MNRKILAIVLTVLGLVGNGAATAELYTYSSTVTLCTGTCASFASLDVGSTVTGTIEVDTTPGGSFGDAEVGAFTFFVFNPAVPPSGPVGDPVNDNPLVIDSGLGIAASNGTAGTTDAANELNGGQMLLEFLVPPFSSNGAFVVFDLSTGNGQVCLFFATAGCIPAATEAVKFEGQFTFISSSFLDTNPNPVDFGQVMIGGAAQADISVTVVGSDDVNFGPIINAPADPFSISQDTCSEQMIPAGGGCTLTVDFMPTSEGIFSHQFGLSHNALAGGGIALVGESVGAGGAAPDAPENLLGRAKRSRVNLRWSGSNTATSFHVFRRLDTEADFSDLGETANRAFVDNLPAGSLSAEYFVVAENADGESDPSSIITVVPTSR